MFFEKSESGRSNQDVRASLDLLRSHKQQQALQAAETLGILYVPLGTEVEDPNDPKAGWKDIYFNGCRIHSVIACVVSENKDPDVGVKLTIQLQLKTARRILLTDGVALLLAEAEQRWARWYMNPERTEVRLSLISRKGYEEFALRLLRIAALHSIQEEEHHA